MNRIALIVVTITATGSASANLLSNPSFETNSYNGPDFATIFAPDSSSIASWSVDLNSVDIVGSNHSPYSGFAMIDIAGSPGPGGVSQLVSAPAGDYTVSFWARSTAGFPNDALIASFGGPDQVISLNSNWTQYSFNQTIGTGALLSIRTRPENNTNGNVFIDDVSVEPVPEPATLIALGAGLIALRRKAR